MRARARLAQVQPRADELSEPSEPAAIALLDQYIAAFEQADLGALERALRADATLEMTPSVTWFAGNRNCLRFIARFLGSPGVYRMRPTRANGQPAFGIYVKDPHAPVFHANGLMVVTLTGNLASALTRFDNSTLPRLGLPRTLPT